MNPLLRVSCLSALLLATFPALAGTTDIRAADRALELQGGVTSLKYGESINNTTFDTETGETTTLDAGATWLTPSTALPPFLNDLYLNFDTQASFGKTHYNGGLQIFNRVTHTITDIPHQSSTDDQIYHLTGKVGKFFAVSDGVALIPYVDLGWRSWRRDILGVGSTTEKYENGEGGGGLLVQISPLPRLVLSASGQIGSTFSATTRSLSDSATFNLGSETVWQLDGKLGYAITPQFELTGEARLDGFGFGASPQVDIGNGLVASEPDSYTHQLSVMAGLAYHL